MSEKEKIKKQIKKKLKPNLGPQVASLTMASASELLHLPLFGSLINGIANIWSETKNNKMNSLITTWLKIQEEEIIEIGHTLSDVVDRLDKADTNIKKRTESQEYLRLVKKCFRDWSAAESEEKRKLIRNLLVNAASTNICSDDHVRLFIEWISKYSEAHFKVIKEIFHHPRITRCRIWHNIHDNKVREDSPEADLFKTIIFDLNVGHIIRQYKETDYNGNFIKARKMHKTPSPNSIYKSAFDDNEPYILTALGSWFVSYTMNETVPRIATPD